MADSRPISVLLTFVTRMMRHQPGIVGMQDAALLLLDSFMASFCYGPATGALVRLGEITVIPRLHRMEEAENPLLQSGICPEWGQRAAARDTGTKLVRFFWRCGRPGRLHGIAVGRISQYGATVDRNRSNQT